MDDFPINKNPSFLGYQVKNPDEETSKKPLIYYHYSHLSSFEILQATSHEYSKLTELNDFLLELTKFILRSAKSDNKDHENESNLNNLNETIDEYVANYMNGDYILLKSFQFIQSTYLNRLCFIAHFTKLFNLMSEGVNFNGNDYFQFLKLICGDFSQELVGKTIKFIIKEKNYDEKQNLKVIIPGKTFVKSLFLTMVYKEFWIA